jgi:hypothetical protein
VRPGPRNWSIFEKLLRLAEAKGTLVPEAARRSM